MNPDLPVPTADLPPVSHRAPRVPLRMVLLSIAGFWLFYFVLNSVRTYVGHSGNQWGMMERRTAVTFAGMAFVFLMYLVLRRLEDRSLGLLIPVAFLTAAPVTLAYAAFNYAAFYVVEPLNWAHSEMTAPMESHSEPAMIIADTALSWYLFVSAWAVLYIALTYAERVRAAERSAAHFRAEAQTAQLRALRYQINPHFLFNTLNSLSTLILRHRNDEAERMIMSLATFFRTSLTGDPTEDILLSDEIRMQRLYLDIEQSRFPDRLMVNIDVPPELEATPVPGFILQPLVENAIKYGVSRSLRPVTISIRAGSDAESLTLTVEDDGEAMSESMPGTGVGLRNVRERLAARFADAAACHYGPKAGGGFRIDLRMPLSRPAIAS